jgi:hypothetical protein
MYYIVILAKIGFEKPLPQNPEIKQDPEQILSPAGLMLELISLACTIFCEEHKWYLYLNLQLYSV